MIRLLLLTAVIAVASIGGAPVPPYNPCRMCDEREEGQGWEHACKVHGEYMFWYEGCDHVDDWLDGLCDNMHDRCSGQQTFAEPIRTIQDIGGPQAGVVAALLETYPRHVAYDAESGDLRLYDCFMNVLTEHRFDDEDRVTINKAIFDT